MKAFVINEGIGLLRAKRVLCQVLMVFLVSTLEKDTAMFKITRWNETKASDLDTQ